MIDSYNKPGLPENVVKQVIRSVADDMDQDFCELADRFALYIDDVEDIFQTIIYDWVWVDMYMDDKPDSNFNHLYEAHFNMNG